MNMTQPIAPNTTFTEDITNGSVDFLYTVTPDLDRHEMRNDVNPSIVLGFLIAVFVTGIICNVAVIYFIASDRKLHRAPFYFLACICVTDLSKTVFCLPFVLTVVYNNFEWTYSEQVCTIIAFLNSFFSVSTSIGLLAAVIDRYLSMTSPRFYNKCSHGLVNLAVIVVGWGAAFCLSFPSIFERDAYMFIRSEMQCSFHHQTYRKNDTLGYTVSFTCILAVVLFLHCRLFSFLRTHRRMAPLYHEPARSTNWTFFGPGANGQALINLLNGFTGGAPSAFANAAQNAQQFGRVVNLRVLRNEHLSRLFFIASVVYILTWIPYLFQTFVKVFGDNSYLSVAFVAVATILSHSNVAVCPVIYLLFGSPLRESIFDRSRNLRVRHVYTGIAQGDPEIPEPSVRCIELEV